MNNTHHARQAALEVIDDYRHRLHGPLSALGVKTIMRHVIADAQVMLHAHGGDAVVERLLHHHREKAERLHETKAQEAIERLRAEILHAEAPTVSPEHSSETV